MLECVTYCNSTKSAVENINRMGKPYSTKVSCRRWPLQIFHKVFDLAMINSVVISRVVTGDKISRMNYILKVIEDLATFIKTANKIVELSEEEALKEESEEERACKLKT